MNLLIFIFKIIDLSSYKRIPFFFLFFLMMSFLLTIILYEEFIIYNINITESNNSNALIFFHISSALLAFFYFYILIFFSINFIFFKIIFFFISPVHSSLALFFCFVNIWTGICWGLPIWGTSFPFEDGRLLFMIFYLCFLYLFHNIDLKNHSQELQKVKYILFVVGALLIPIVKFAISHWSTLHQPESVQGLYFNNLDSIFPLVFLFFFSLLNVSFSFYKELFISSFLNKYSFYF